MKKFIAIVAMVVSVFTANAQSNSNSCQDINTVSIKPYAGLSLAGLSSSDEHTGSRTGFTAGVEAQYQLSKTFAISGGVAYQQQGGKANCSQISFNDGSMGAGKLNIKMDYINVPVMANFYVCKGFALKAGLQAGFAVNRKVAASITGVNSTKNESFTADKIRKFDIAMPVGMSYEYKNVVVDGRVNIGLLGIFKSKGVASSTNFNNTVVQLTAGYRF